MKVIYNALSKTLLYHCKNPEKPRVLLLGPTRISAVNIGGRTTIHSGLRIKPGIKLLESNDKSKVLLKKRLSEVKLFIIDELSIESSDLWTWLKVAGLSVMTVADLLQLPPVKGKLMYETFIRFTLMAYIQICRINWSCKTKW